MDTAAEAEVPISSGIDSGETAFGPFSSSSLGLASSVPMPPMPGPISVAPGLDLADVVALELDAVLVLDDLRELGEVERIDVELLERGVAGDLRLVDAELRKRLVDGLLDGLAGDRGSHGFGFSFSGGHAAVDEQGCAGDVPGVLGGEEP